MLLVLNRSIDKDCSEVLEDISIWQEGNSQALTNNVYRDIHPDVSQSIHPEQFIKECNDDNLIIIPHDEEECKIISSHAIEKTLARFVIFQRNEGYKIYNIISHYASVVSLDSIVVINHQGTDHVTASILESYSEQGMHLWSCNKGFEEKGSMWTNVGKIYAPYSEFLFMLDSDEYMSILSKDELQWNHDVFRQELSYLPRSNKPFKTVRSIPVPIDCPSNRANILNVNGEIGIKAPLCHLQFTESDIAHYCYNKLFFRGEHFNETNDGNHHTNKTWGYNCYKNFGISNSPISLENDLYTLTNFTLLHLQSLEFNDFMTHILRGASATGYNQEGTICRNGVPNFHYCVGYQELKSVNFDLDKMREMYERKRCQCYKENSYSNLNSVKNVFAPLCSAQMDKIDKMNQ